jgi:hypothetical protein
MLEAPQALLDERRRLGLDRRDEMWDGVLHVVPPPKDAHQSLGAEFFLDRVWEAGQRSHSARAAMRTVAW